MDIRKVQRTGEMHYVYLPTSWCKKYDMTSDAQVSLTENPDGSLVVSAELQDRKPKHVRLSLDETNPEILHKILVACYINPLTSFQIDLEKELDFAKLLEQKKLISLESVELDKKKITYEGSISVTDPSSLLKTMIRKVKNMLIVMTKNYDKELIGRYEEEIDRLKMLIDKSIISTLMYYTPTKLTTIDLYYLSLISKDLERLVDHLGMIPKKESKFLKELDTVIETLKGILESESKQKSFTIDTALEFTKKAVLFDKKGSSDYHKARIRATLKTISEVILDWSVTKEIESK